jgi:hypothetical protein
MLQAVEFPTGITNLAASLANMNGDTLTSSSKHFDGFFVFVLEEKE